MRYFAVFITLLIFSSNANALRLKDCKLTESQEQASLDEHIYGGSLDDSKLYERRAYVLAYDDANLVPKWAAWHAQKSYRDTPTRKSRWSSFRTDPEISTVKDDDYVGWYDSEKNYARGHIVPYYISGGDRDHDGKNAYYEDQSIEDVDDACTIYEVNSMSNIAPQYHDKFNGVGGGLWYALETDIRALIDNGASFNIYAGTIFSANTPIERIGDRDDEASTWKIGVPHGFFKVVINDQRDEAVAFIFDHASNLETGCDLASISVRYPSDCIRPIEEVEKLTGLTFFKKIEGPLKQRLRTTSKKETWISWLSKY